MKRNKCTLGLFIMMIVALALTTVTACEGSKKHETTGLENKRAEITIWSIEPRSLEGYISPGVIYKCPLCKDVLLTAERHVLCPNCGTMMARALSEEPKLGFHIKIKPLSVVPDENYYLVFISRTGYLYDLVPMLWKQDEFVGVDPDERDIRKIKEAEAKPNRREVFYVNSSDKEIDPLWREFNQFYTECREQAALHGELQFRGQDGWNAGSFEPDESDFQRICNKYIEIKLLTFEECKLIEGAGTYLGF